MPRPVVRVHDHNFFGSTHSFLFKNLEAMCTELMQHCPSANQRVLRELPRKMLPKTMVNAPVLNVELINDLSRMAPCNAHAPDQYRDSEWSVYAMYNGLFNTRQINLITVMFWTLVEMGVIIYPQPERLLRHILSLLPHQYPQEVLSNALDSEA